MKIQFLLISAVWVYRASAGYSGSDASDFVHSYGGALINDHVPIIRNGVPVDTPEVQAAKAAHFEAYNRAAIQAAKQPSDGQYREDIQIYQQKPIAVYHQRGYTLRDSPAVQQAKAFHYGALNQVSYQDGYRFKRSIVHGLGYDQYIPVIKNGVPEDTPEVEFAKYQHLVAHGVARARKHGDYETNELSSGIRQHDALNDGHYHIPIIGKDGVPVNTPEVQSARIGHLLAHYYAKSGQHDEQNSVGVYSDHLPIIGPNGVPYDTAEVQIAKAEHLAAHAKASSNHNQWRLPQGYGSNYYSARY